MSTPLLPAACLSAPSFKAPSWTRCPGTHACSQSVTGSNSCSPAFQFLPPGVLLQHLARTIYHWRLSNSHISTDPRRLTRLGPGSRGQNQGTMFLLFVYLRGTLPTKKGNGERSGTWLDLVAPVKSHWLKPSGDVDSRRTPCGRIHPLGHRGHSGSSLQPG